MQIKLEKLIKWLLQDIAKYSECAKISKACKNIIAIAKDILHINKHSTNAIFKGQSEFQVKFGKLGGVRRLRLLLAALFRYLNCENLRNCDKAMSLSHFKSKTSFSVSLCWLFPLHTPSRACRLISFPISLSLAPKFLTDLKLFQFDSIILFKHIDFVWKMPF